MRKIKIILLVVCGLVLIAVCMLLSNPGEDVYNGYMSMYDNSGYNSKSRFKKEYDYIREKKQSNQQNANSNSTGTGDLNGLTVPDNLDDIEAYKAYVTNLPINQKRKDLILAGLSMFKKATYSKTEDGHNNWNKPTFTQIECSGFTAWCYNQVGIKFGAPSTSGYVENKYMTVVDNKDSIPGDIGHIYGKERGKGSGHVGIYIGVNSAGDRVYLDAGSSMCPKLVVHKQLDTRTWRIKEMQQYD